MDCETGHSAGCRSQYRAIEETIQQHVTDFCRIMLAKQVDGQRRFDDSKNKEPISRFSSSSSSFLLSRDNASKKMVLSRRGIILLGSALLLCFVLLQHTLVNQSRFYYEIHLQKRHALFLENNNTRTPTTSRTRVVSSSTSSIRKLANNSDKSKEEPSQRMDTSQGTIIAAAAAAADSDVTPDRTTTTVCWPWSYSSDEWWTHHPTWKRSHANDTHYCYQQIQNERQAALYQAIYDVQFRNAGDCKDVFRRHMWSSGLGADFMNVNRGLFQAVLFERPFQITDQYPWHYAAGKDDHLANETTAACPSRDMYCYFLPLTKCPAVGEESSDNETLLDVFSTEDTPLILPTSNDNFNDDTYLYHVWDETVYQWIFEYATRPQTWLWRKVYEYKQSRLNLTTPCMVMHVRRADVIHHSDGFARRYFSIAEYVNASKRANIIPPNDDDHTVTKPNIFLITDDANAIGEALSEFPTYNWMYIRRKRYKADEGGWEEQTPSRDYVFEMTTLLSILELAPHCSAIVHGQSSFADLVVRSMKSHRPQHGSDLKIARVDDNITIYDPMNLHFRNVSKEYHIDDDSSSQSQQNPGTTTTTTTTTSA
ncbi:hypothetical protein IV203_021493 [Nitzschia inconspicua]|uniref:Alpha-(1,6)-fucosyltransferase N- and catalytic domain-containing protein n=1 Tax=Nitzschia inconspicua TaxID=303405 RepID=A0A9K3KIP3_9STRA|nr:hypothetical protein IV203_022690 [Nitzschia inconspicua]KAG7343548.1 hypothetical protein IV203_021493 [Nitzschia inconspicua]